MIGRHLLCLRPLASPPPLFPHPPENAHGTDGQWQPQLNAAGPLARGAGLDRESGSARRRRDYARHKKLPHNLVPSISQKKHPDKSAYRYRKGSLAEKEWVDTLMMICTFPPFCCVSAAARHRKLHCMPLLRSAPCSRLGVGSVDRLIGLCRPDRNFHSPKSSSPCTALFHKTWTQTYSRRRLRQSRP